LAVERKRLAGGRAESSGGFSDHKGRMALWEAQVPGKIKVHMWRLMENGLAVGTELARRRIKDGIVCLACGRTEDLVHRFWVCPHSISAWSYLTELTGFTAPPPPKRLVHHSDLKGWLLDWIGKANVDQAAWFLTMSYKLWLARNEARESARLADPKAIASSVKEAVEEWFSLRTPLRPRGLSPREHWLCPEPDWIKANTDGAFRSADGNGGSGVVLRNHHGDFVSGETHFFSHVADAEMAELLACRRGVLLARENQVHKLVLETDSTGVAAKLCRAERDRSLNGVLVEEIKALLKGFGDHRVQAVRRSANEVAHLLAKLGCENKLCNVWNGVAPIEIMDQLVLDVSI
jgi:ribonuclease HI